MGGFAPARLSVATPLRRMALTRAMRPAGSRGSLAVASARRLESSKLSSANRQSQRAESKGGRGATEECRGGLRHSGSGADQGAAPASAGLGSIVRIPVPGTGGLAIELRPRGWTPKAGSTSSLFIQDLSGKRHLRLDFGFDKVSQIHEWHWNQKGTAATFGDSSCDEHRHRPQAALRAEGLADRPAKTGSRAHSAPDMASGARTRGRRNTPCDPIGAGGGTMLCRFLLVRRRRRKRHLDRGTNTSSWAFAPTCRDLSR